MPRISYLIFIAWLGIQVTYAQPTSYDQDLGKRGSAEVELMLGVYEDEKLNAYLDEIGERLTDHLHSNPFQYQFKILDDPIPNAFALPGGYVYVTRGLLALVNNVDELACVISHEIIHVQKRHSIRQMKRKMIPALLQIPGMVIGAVAGEQVGRIINAPIAIGSSFFVSKYSRKHESEADQLGARLAARAGFDPNALSPILARISEWESLRTEEEEKKDYFSSHPYTPDRVRDLSHIVDALDWSQNEMHKQPILPLLEGLTFDENPDKGLFVDSLFLHPTIDFSIVFPANYEYLNQYNAVGAKDQEKESYLFLTIEDTTSTPEEYGVRYLERVKSNSRISAVKGEEIKVNQHSAFMVSTIEDYKGERTFSYYLWIAMNDQVYKIIGIHPEDFKEEVKSTALSLHQLTEKEKSLVNKKVISILAAKDEENLKDLAKRSGNQIDLEKLYSLNGVESEKSTIKDKSIKVVKSVGYFD
ncbi:M48 family metalloprotease [Reichenbachiella ulvae]|uniref:M48 family metalloprotease n=1 Tax=Reichenbachiella ulvae TaxID=2980104 RepID=A0ABT3CXX5_9BACT|nr:M48 family metalloprotease [Reichenbachiella ulvae]MCV9388403.1 M48 family metalloprotease [Reichenbachiella ulvae]